MSYTIASTDDVDSVMEGEYGGMWFLRDELETETLGVTMLELEPGAKGKEHDHEHDGQEEVYVVVDGSVSVNLDGETVQVNEGEAIRLSPDQTRQLHNDGDSTVRLVLVGTATESPRQSGTVKPLGSVGCGMIENLAAGVQAFTSNVFFVDGDRRVVVDTGANFDVVSRIEQRGGIDAVVMTHTHPDHVGNLESVKSTFDVQAWGFDTDQPRIDEPIADEETVRIGDHDYVALHTPGHKNDHLCFYSEDAGVLFAGDLVFQNGSFGRTDLEEGDHDALVASIDRVEDRIDHDLQEMHVGHGQSVTTDPYSHVEMAARMARSMRG